MFGNMYKRSISRFHQWPDVLSEAGKKKTKTRGTRY